MSRDRSKHGRRHDSEDLLDGATAGFAMLGYGSSMDAVAERAGTTKPTLYKRFGSRDDLDATCLNREIERLQSHLFSAYAQAARRPVREQVSNAYAAFFDYAEARPEAFRLIFAERQPAFGTAIVDGFIQSIIDRQMLWAGRVTSSDLEPEEQRLYVSMIVGIAAQGARQLVADGGTVSAARATEIATTLAWSGFPAL